MLKRLGSYQRAISEEVNDPQSKGILILLTLLCLVTSSLNGTKINDRKDDGERRRTRETPTTRMTVGSSRRKRLASFGLSVVIWRRGHGIVRHKDLTEPKRNSMPLPSQTSDDHEGCERLGIKDNPLAVQREEEEG